MRLGLIGYPLGHSFSAKYFAEKFNNLGIKGSYTPFPLKYLSDLQAFIKDCNIDGFNVTIPYKEQILPYLDFLSNDAIEIGAVNTVKRILLENGQSVFKGYNTDWIGFSDSLKPLLRNDIKKALILGTGGAAKAVAYALKLLNIETIVVTRNLNDINIFTFDGNCIEYKDISSELISECLLIVNTTPLGMFPNCESFPNLPYELLTAKHICFDLVYNPEETMFMRLASKSGARVKNGLEMLHMQADAAWNIWNQLDV